MWFVLKLQDRKRNPDLYDLFKEVVNYFGIDFSEKQAISTQWVIKKIEEYQSAIASEKLIEEIGFGVTNKKRSFSEIVLHVFKQMETSRMTKEQKEFALDMVSSLIDFNKQKRTNEITHSTQWDGKKDKGEELGWGEVNTKWNNSSNIIY